MSERRAHIGKKLTGSLPLTSFILLSLFLATFIIGMIPVTVLAQDEFIQPELNWETIETPHFVVDYYPGEERTAQIVAKIAEEIYGPLTKLYKHEPDQKVTFVIWDNDDYSNGETYFFDNKINIWATSLDFDLRGTHNWLRNVITHEFTHEIQMNTATKFGRHFPAFYLQWLGYESERRPDVLYGYPNTVVSYPVSGIVIPAWFAEGVAQYNIPHLHYDYWDTHRDMILREYVLNHKMFTLDEMGGFGKTSLGNESTYNAGFAFVHYLATKYGPDVLQKLSVAMRDVNAVSINHAFEKVLGRSADDVYSEWKSFLEKTYSAKTDAIVKSLHAGKIISDVGFANLFPVYSPDGRSLAYCSNKGYDFFGTSSIYVRNLESNTEKEITDKVSSELSWSPDGRYLVYSRQSRHNPFWNSLDDIYSFDLKNGNETRLSHGLRARYPSLSKDGRHVSFVANDDKPLGLLCRFVKLTTGVNVGGTDGTANLYTADIDLAQGKLSNIRRLTNFMNGEQVYAPRWSQDGSKIAFSYSIAASRRIAVYDLADSSCSFITPAGQDSRDPVFTQNDSAIVFSSDRSGIFNIYSMDVHSRSTVALTNVVGGAFEPALSPKGDLVYSSYQWNGYKIAEINGAQAVPDPPAYSVDINPPSLIASTSAEALPSDLTHYNDFHVPSLKSEPYHNSTTSMSFYPVLLFDNYNPHKSFLDELKAGIYFTSMDMVGKYDIFGGATINKLLERDIFFQLDYNDKIPGLSSLGIYPQFTLAAYNLTRQTNAEIGLGLDTIPVGVNYDLLEVDASFGGHVLSPALSMAIGFTFDRYTSTVGGFILPDLGLPVGSSGDVYFLGRSMYAEFDLDGIMPSRNSWVNPLGIRSRLRITGSLDKLNADGNYQFENGVLVPIYQNFNFVQAEFLNYFAVPVLRDDDAIATKLHLGYTFGAPLNNFFDFYAGGLIGMRGYPFYAIGGNRMASLNLTYRYPLFRDVNKQFLQFFLSDVYLSAFGDIGNAWDGTPIGTRFKKDAGGEVRFSGFSFYSFPTALFFDAVYSFDKFSEQVPQFKTYATYGREWRFYFGLTFSFDIVDFGRQGCARLF